MSTKIEISVIKTGKQYTFTSESESTTEVLEALQLFKAKNLGDEVGKINYFDAPRYGITETQASDIINY